MKPIKEIAAEIALDLFTAGGVYHVKSLVLTNNNGVTNLGGWAESVVRDRIEAILDRELSDNDGALKKRVAQLEKELMDYWDRDHG